jgi:hypothetical protein
LQLALPGFPEQLASHSAANVAWQEAEHSPLFAELAHWALQLAVASSLQLAEQSNSAGFTVQLASQSTWQLPEH